MEPGQTNNPNGRPKGSLNKKNQEIVDMANELGCNPAKILMLMVAGDRRKLGYECRYEVEKRNYQRAFEDYEKKLSAYDELSAIEKKKTEKPGPPSPLIEYTDQEIIEMNMVALGERGDRAEELMPYLYGKRKPIDSEGNDKSDVISDILEAIDASK